MSSYKNIEEKTKNEKLVGITSKVQKTKSSASRIGLTVTIFHIRH